MTKEELERIKQAYNSGLKVQVWFDGHWENFDAREYSMYPEPFSENRQYRIVGSDYADIAEKQIVELKYQIEKMKCCENCRWEEPSSFCDGCKRLKGQIFSDVITNDNWELRRYKNA